MKTINIVLACSLLMTAIPSLAAMDNDPEMDKVDTSADMRMEPPKGLNTETLVEVTATVTAVDMPNRLVTIEGPEGNTAVIQVTEQVKNLPQVEIGDKVNIKYYLSAIVDVVKAGGDVELGTTGGAARISAPAGEKPGGAAVVEMTRRVEVVFVDPIQKFISVRSPDRGLRKVSLKESPDLQHYLKELKEGDVIEVTYTDAVAVEVVPAD